MANIERRSLHLRWNNIVGECLGLAANAPILWLLYGVSVYYGAVFPTAIFVALILTTVVVLVVAFLSFDLQLSSECEQGPMDFLGDIHEKLAETFLICLALLAALSLIGLALTWMFA